jgi:hypothetical protein
MITQDRGLLRAAEALRADDLRWAERERLRRSAQGDDPMDVRGRGIRFPSLWQAIRRRIAGTAAA